VAIVLVFSLSWWVIDARRWFKGPVAQVRLLGGRLGDSRGRVPRAHAWLRKCMCATLALLPVLPACLLVSQLRRSRSPHRHPCRHLLLLQVSNDSAYLSNRVEEGDGFLVAVGKTHPVVA
jgi:hypothetical protein